MNKSSKYQTGGLEDLSAEDILENSSNFSGSNVESGAYDEGYDSDIPEDNFLKDFLVAEGAMQAESLGAPVENVGQYMDDDFGKYKQDRKITLPEQLDDVSDYRGATQSTGDKWGNGILKAAGKTVVNIYGSTIGLGQGIYSGIRDGEWNSFYNNEFARDIDKVNEWFDETLPNHYTRAEREKGLWDQAGTANFYADKVLNGLSFLAGAALTEMGLSALTAFTWGGASGVQAAGTVGLLARASRLFKNAALSNRLGGIGMRAGKYANTKTILSTGKMIRQLATGAAYESGIESRHTYDTGKANYTNVALEGKGFSPEDIATMSEEDKFNALTVKERQDIHDASAKMSNIVFAGNFGLVGASNMIMIPKLYGLGAHNIFRKIPGGTFLKEASKFAKSKSKDFLKKGLEKTNFGRKALELAKNPGAIKAGDWARTLGTGVGKGFYEGVVEEGLQGTMQRAAADYALLSGIRDDSGMMDIISSTWDSFLEGGEQTYTTDEGLTEVVIGAGLGFLGLPGVNTTLVQAHKETTARRKTINFLQEMQDKHPDVLSALRANMHFFQNVGKRSSLLDSAYESGDMALVKDLEHDDFFDFVMARIIQEDFQSIEDQSKAISEMSPEEFRAWGTYTVENLPDNELDARKALVVENVNRRAKAIKNSADQVDSHLRLSYREKVLGMMEPGTMGFLRQQLIHSLSVIDNADERETAMTAELARLTGGTVVSQTKGVKFRGKFKGEEDRTDAIQYVDKDGNTRTVDIGAFSQDGELRSYLSITSQNIKALEAKKKAGEKTMPLKELREIDESLESLYADKLALEEALKILSDEKTLSPEEFDEIIAPWKASDPEGAAVNEQEVYRYLTDLRKLRGRRQKAAELYKQLMDPTYRPQAIQNIIEKINHVEEDKTEAEKAAEKAKTAADKKRLEEFLAKAVEAKKVTKRSILSLEQQVKEFEDLMDLYLSELVENVDKLEKGKVRDKNGRFLKVKPIKDAIAKAEEAIKEGEEILKGLAQDIENQLEVLVSIEELENNPPNLNLYATEMHGSIQNMLKATGLANLQEIEGRRQEALNTMEGMPYNTVWDRNLRTVDQVSDALRVSKIKAKQLLEQATAINTKYAKELQEKDVLETLKMSFFQDIKNFRKDETKHLQAMEKAAGVVQEQLLKLQGYKEILETLLEEQKKTKGLDLFTSAELDANVAFLNSELLLTDESIKAIKEGDNLGLFNRESMASAALALTAQELENSYTEYYAYTLIESMKTSKDTSPSPNKPSSKRTPSFEDAETTKGVISKLQKADIKDTGFFKTSGGHKADIDKGILHGAIDDFNELSKYDFEDLNESDKKKFLNAKSQLRFFNWIHSHKITSTKSKGKLYSDYSVAAVTIHNIPQELRDLGLTEDLFYDEDDIKLVVFKEQEFEGVDKNKKPTYKRINQFETDGNGLPIYTSALLPVHTKGEGNSKRDVFRNDHNIPESQKDNIASKYKAWREDIIDNAKEHGDVFLFPVTDKAMGSINLGKALVQNAGILSKKNDYVNTKLYIGSSAKGLENVVEVPVGTTTVLSRPGLVWAWDNARGIPIPMTGRLLSNAEVDNVALMMHKLLKIRQEAYDAQSADKKNWPDAWTIAKSHEEVINGKKFNLKDALGDIVYTRSAKSEIDKKEYQLVFSKGTFVFGADDLVIELKDFAEDTEVLAELKKFLATKYHNVNSGTLNNEKEKVSWGEIVLADNADLSLDEEKSTVWKNYNEYLLKDRKGDDLSPLQTRAHPISSNEDPDVLNAPRFYGGYLVFEGNESYRKSLEGVRNKYAAKKGTRKKSTAQEEGDDVVDILNETGSNVETRTDVDTDPNIRDITDLQPPETNTEVDPELTDDEVVDIALNNYIDGLTPKGIVDLLQNEDRQDATKQVVINRYIKDDLKVAQTKALEEFFATKEGKRIVDRFTKKAPSTKPNTTTTQQSSEVDFDKLKEESKKKGVTIFELKDWSLKEPIQNGENTITHIIPNPTQGNFKVLFNRPTGQWMAKFSLKDGVVQKKLFKNEGTKSEPSMISSSKMSEDFMDESISAAIPADLITSITEDLKNVPPQTDTKLNTKDFAYTESIDKKYGIKKTLGDIIKPTQQTSDTTTAPTTESLEDLNDDEVFMTSSYELPSTLYIQETYGEELARVKGMTSTEIIPVIGMIASMSGEGYAQLTKAGQILISNLATRGALYHETFHDVSLTMLSPEHRKRIYNIVRLSKGEALTYKEIAKAEQDPTYTPVAKALSEFTDKEAEEWLAEEFRRYVLSKGKYVLGQDTLTAKQRNIFQKLFDFIRDTFRGVFGLDTGLEIDPEMTEVKDLFQKIADGGFKNAQRSLEYLNSLEEPVFMQASLIENHQSSIFKADLNSTLTAYFADSLQSIVYTDSQGEEAISSIAFSDFLDTTVEDRNLAINQAYRDAWKKMHVDYTQALLEEKKGTPEYNVIHSAFQTMFDATPGKTPIKGKIRTLGVERRLEATLVNKEYLKNLGVDFEVEDARDEDEVGSKMFSDVIDELQISPTDSAKGILKFMLGTIPNNTGETNSTGLKGAYELKTILKNLQTNLAGTLNYADQIEAIEDLEYKYPWAPQVIDRLGNYKVDSSTSIEDILLRVAFRNQFAKTMYDTAYDVLQESGKIYTIDPSLERNLRGIRTRWNSYLRIKSKKASHISIDPQGNIVFDPNAKSNFKNRSRTLQGVYEHVKSKSPSLKLDALEHIGIIFSNREELEDILKYNPETTLRGSEVTYLEAVNDALAFVYKDLTTGSTSLAALFDRGEAQSVTRMNALAKIELETTNSDYELQHQNPEGKLVYSVSLNNYLSTIANLPLEEIDKYFSSDNSPFKNPYAFSSLTVKAIKSDPSSKIRIIVREGLGIEGPGQTGVKASKLRTTDKLVSYIESIMQGNMPMIQAADIATNFAVKFPIKAYKDINSLKEVMLNYLTDEIVSSATALDENVDVEYFSERVKRLRMFESLIGKADSSVKEGISKLMLDPKTSRGKASKFVQEHADNLFASIESNLRLDMDALIAKMEDLKVVVKNTDGSYNLLGLNRDRFGSTLPDNVTEQQLRNFVEEVVARQTVYKNELFKVFFGDPAFYKAVFKRVKGAVGVKDVFYTGPEVDKFLNTKNPRVDIDGTISNGEETLVVIKEPRRITPFLEEYERSLSPKVAEAYRAAAEKADGSLIVTLPAYREMAIRGNAWSPSLEKIYENVMERGDTVTEEIMGKFPPLKFQYFGYLPSELNTQSLGFFKMSVAPIYPQLGEMGDKVFPGISNMYKFLTENKLGGIVLPSAFKIGVPGENSRLELMEGDAIRTSEDLKNSFENSNSVTIDYRFMGTQLEVPSKFKYTSPLATQARTQVMSDLFENGRIRPEFAELEPTVTRYNAVLNGLIGEGYKELLTELNLEISKDKDGNPIVGEGGGVTYKVINNDYSKFISAIKDESIRRDMPPQILSSLDALSKRSEEDLPVYFDAVSNKGRLEGVLWSLAGKKVIRQRFKGDMYVQQSSLGFETVRYKDLNTDELGEEFAEPLKPYTIGDQYMEVYAPHYFKELIGKDVQVTKDGLVSNGEIVGDLSLLEAIGIRIPTDGIHSIEAIRIKGFLPRSQGATVVIPSEMVTKSGSDFDIDKLVMYFPSYKMRGNQIIKEKFYDSLEEWYNAEQRILNRNMRALEEMESVMDSVEERDQLIKMLTDSFTSKIFGEDIATELFKDSKEDMSAEQADRLANYFNSNPEEIRKSYARIKKIIAKQEIFSKPFEEWQAKNPEATVYNSQSKGAMQNAIMDDMVALLQAKGVTNARGIEERYDTWMQPVNIDDITAISENVSSLFKGDKKLSNLSEINDYHLDTTIPNLIDVSDAYDKGKVLVGIMALASTHHVKSQIAGLELNADMQIKLPNREKRDLSINFEGFDPKALVYSLSGVTDVFGRMRISDVLSQLVNASVDVVNNPILHKLNITPDNANMWILLLRAGVPVDSVAMFANQPIIKDYLKLLEIGRSQTMKAMKDAQYDDKIFDSLVENYGTDAKVPIIALTAGGLESMVGKSLNDVDPELNLTEDEKAVQLQILNDMFIYSKVGEHLGNVVTRQSFDTKIPKSRNHLRITLDMYNTAVSTGLFNNVQNIAGMEVPSLEGQPITEVTENFQGYKGGFVNKGKGTPQGDGKDIAMREIADSALVELTSDKPSSSKTTIDQLGEIDENSNIIMLARNGKLKGKPLRDETKRRIDQAMVLQNEYGVPIEFVVGDMPGVDSQFIDYLQEIGAKFTIYHTGNTSRISIPISQPTTEVTEGVSERYSYKEDIVNKFDTDVDTIINGMRNVSIADNIDYNIELEIQKAEENNLKYFISTDSSPEAIEYFGKPVESYTFYNEKGKDQAEIIHRLETEDLNISNEEKSAVLGYMLQYNLNEVSDFTGISIEDIETLAESLLAPKGTTDTFMRSMTAYNYSMQNIFNEIFLTEKQNSTYQEGFADIQRIFSNPEIKGYSIDDRANILNKYENGFISFIAQNLTINRKTMIGDNIESLMFGDESIAITFQNIQDPKKKHPLKMNPFINSLIGNISPAREGKDKTNDYLQPVNRTMTPFEMKTLHDAFREIEAIDPKLAKNIIKTALLQAGVGSSTVSFLNTIPGDSVLELMGPYLDVYKTGKASVQFEELLANYFDHFFKDNHNNPQIVPKHNKYSKKLFPYTYLITKESKKEYSEASKRGLPAPKVVKIFYRNTQIDSGGNASNSFESIPTSVSGTSTLQILKDKLYIPANGVLGKHSEVNTKEQKDEDENNCEL
jgi:truncated hemoglobin YjbI